MENHKGDNIDKLVEELSNNFSPEEYWLMLGSDIEIDSNFYRKNRIFGDDTYLKIPNWSYRKYWHCSEGADGLCYFIDEMRPDIVHNWFLELFKITKSITFNSIYNPENYDIVLHKCSDRITDPILKKAIETINTKTKTVNLTWYKSTLKQQIADFEQPKFDTVYNIEFVDDEKK